MRRVLAFIAFAAAGFTLIPSCGSTPACASWQSPCAAWFDVVAYCDETGACTLDGAPADCAKGACVLRLGGSLEIPVGDFAAELGSRHDLRVSTLAIQGEVWPSIDAALDGVAGDDPQWDDDYPDITGFRWQPFPSSPDVLEVRYGNEPAGSPAKFGLVFVDGACEAANPPPDCPL